MGNLALTPTAEGTRRFLDLLLSLTWRDLRVRYAQSLLGIGWSILLPFSMMLIFTFVLSRAVHLGDGSGDAPPYALYAFAGLVPWTFFSQSVTACVGVLVANRNLVTKVYFPREVFPLSCVLGGLVDMAIAMVAMFGLMLYFHFRGEWIITPSPAWAALPLITLVHAVLAAGVGMWLAMANLFYRDVRPLVTVAVNLLMFVSGVVVPITQDGSLTSRVLQLNPVVPIIAAYRDCLLRGAWPGGLGLAYAVAAAVVVLGVSWTWFRRASYRFAECI